jgi:hypothetical protein
MPLEQLAEGSRLVHRTSDRGCVGCLRPSRFAHHDQLSAMPQKVPLPILPIGDGTFRA